MDIFLDHERRSYRTLIDSHEITMYDIHEIVCDTMSDTW